MKSQPQSTRSINVSDQRGNRPFAGGKASIIEIDTNGEHLHVSNNNKTLEHDHHHYIFILVYFACNPNLTIVFNFSIFSSKFEVVAFPPPFPPKNTYRLPQAF